MGCDVYAGDRPNFVSPSPTFTKVPSWPTINQRPSMALLHQRRSTAVILSPVTRQDTHFGSRRRYGQANGCLQSHWHISLPAVPYEGNIFRRRQHKSASIPEGSDVIGCPPHGTDLDWNGHHWFRKTSNGLRKKTQKQPRGFVGVSSCLFPDSE